ncbi:MAG: ATP-grasp domain-containing protein, partial [Actinobacteria bacterium]|nr:ATP-grasp domain-containing protein [Actinomycetota bacterium]
AKKYGFNFIYYGKNPRETLKNFKAEIFIEKTLDFINENNISAVIATHDYPAAMIGSIVAKKAGFISPEVEQILLCQHKYYCRQVQKKYFPEAYVESKIVNPFKKGALPFKFPFFIKPVKSFFSIMAAQINNIDEYNEYIEKAKDHINDFCAVLNELIKKYSSFRYDANYLIAEKLLCGKQVTLEAFSYRGNVKIIGIVDSVMYKNKISFKRFDYPSTLKPDVSKKMETIATGFIKRTNFDNGIINIEFFYNPKQDYVKIIEVNPRMCSQFADIMEKVNGVNTYEIQLFISLGIDPEVLFKSSLGLKKYNYSSSFVLRSLKDKKIKRLPSEKQIKAIRSIFPDIRIEIYGSKNKKLSDELNDMNSYRYGIINLGADSRSELHSKYKKCISMLDFEFE